MINDTPLTAVSVTQKSTSFSTSEAEYQALVAVVRELVWIRVLLHEMGYPQEATPMYEDNSAAIDMDTRVGMCVREAVARGGCGSRRHRVGEGGYWRPTGGWDDEGAGEGFVREPRWPVHGGDVGDVLESRKRRAIDCWTDSLVRGRQKKGGKDGPVLCLYVLCICA